VRQKPAYHMWRGFNLSRYFSHSLWVLVCVGWGLVVVWGETGMTPQRDFATWLQELCAEAVALGIRPQTLDTALAGLQPLARVIELDRKQPEVTLTYAQYFERTLPASRLQKGLRLLNEHRALLQEIGTKYGVPPGIIVALWGIETDFGRLTGHFPVLAALATLAYDGRRSALFRRELLEALKIVDAGQVRPEVMTGSWAGAMGQNQFMPSSFVQYAVDYNGDGRRDIWTTLADVFASTANYLASSGWREHATWGHRVLLPTGFDVATNSGQVSKSLADWQALGVQRADGGAFPSGIESASLVLPGGAMHPAFLVYQNYQVLLKWNRSHYFALTVGQFADQLGGK
jgi:membrane-bound lytic murein transglycosylase B